MNLIPPGFYVSSRDDLVIIHPDSTAEIWVNNFWHRFSLSKYEDQERLKRGLSSMEILEQILDEQITQEKLDMEKFHSPLNIGDKVRVTSGHGKGKVGVVSAIYDTRYNTQNWLTGAQYRVSTSDPKFGGVDQGSTIYCNLENLILVNLVTAYCYKKGTELHWFDTEKKRPGFVRESSKDHSFEE